MDYSKQYRYEWLRDYCNRRRNYLHVRQIGPFCDHTLVVVEHKCHDVNQISFA